MNQATWRIGQMNLAIHGLSGSVALQNSLLDDQHATLKADYVIANPPFNQKKWGADRVKDDVRWKWGLPPDGNANYAWIQHFASHLAPDGRAGFVLANGSLTSAQSGEGTIRENARPRRPRRLHRRAAQPTVLHDRDPRLPVVPRSQQGIRGRARPARRDALHRCPLARPQDQPHADRAQRRRDRARRRHLRRVARPGRHRRLRGRARLLRRRRTRRDRASRLHALTRALRRRARGGGGRGRVRGANGRAGGDARGGDGGKRAARRRGQGGAAAGGLWRLNGRVFGLER